jgi:hypothetical protein
MSLTSCSSVPGLGGFDAHRLHTWETASIGKRVECFQDFVRGYAKYLALTDVNMVTTYGSGVTAVTQLQMQAAGTLALAVAAALVLLSATTSLNQGGRG